MIIILNSVNININFHTISIEKQDPTETPK